MPAIDLSDYRIPSGDDAELRKRPTDVAPYYDSRDDYRAKLRQNVDRLRELQERFYAAGSHALLVVFQALDTAGKDGNIRAVLSGVNPQGIAVHSFRQPSATEMEHDFLWRTVQHLPERGMIGVFNRSYYEDVLVVRVHKEILETQGVPQAEDEGPSIWKQRFESIKAHELHLHRNGTRIVKFYLHLSKEEQRKRLLARIDEPEKHWKFRVNDVREREHWDGYIKAYEKCLSATSTDDAPWYAIPADDKPNSHLIVSQAILDAIEALQPDFPKVSPDRLRELDEMRALLKPE